MGLALLACCLIIPQIEANRRLAYEKQKLQTDLERFELQETVNREFLARLGSDPTLAERLAQRQMKMVREGTHVLDLKGSHPGDASISPFVLTAIPPPAPLPEYRPQGLLARAFTDSRTKLYLMGTALLMIATGLILGNGRAE
jgi:hypothetical protein